MFERFQKRSCELEHLDKGDYTSAEYEGCIVELQRINKYLGDARALRRSLLEEIEGTRRRSFSVLDVGAGSGELLRGAAGWAKRTGRGAELTGLELNARSARAILEESGSFDYAICSLMTHHFRDDGVIRILRELRRVARHGLFVIDLHRHALAYLLYTTVGRLFLQNRLIREDGALSIRRSFRPAELDTLARRAGLSNIMVERRFPFRLVLKADGSSREPLSAVASGAVTTRALEDKSAVRAGLVRR
jgi:SAM-dependent methyltransferase